MKRPTSTLTALALVAGLLVGAGAPLPQQGAAAAQGDMIVPATGKVTGIVGQHCGVADKHDGTDIARTGGGPVLAAASGVVTRVVQSSGTANYGTFVTISHGGRYSTLYGHLVFQSTTVREGQTVTKGQQIASMGSTGRSTGVHLHFEVVLDGRSQGGVNGHLSCGRSVTAGTPIDWSFPGFPAAPTQVADQDRDGVPDASDVCPQVPGFAVYDGCGLPRSGNGTDLDGDGRADVFYGSPGGRWYASSAGTAEWRALAQDAVPVEQVQFGDFDGDGKDDVFKVDRAGAWLVSYGGTGSWTRINGDVGVEGHLLQIGDLDGDGRADVFFPHAAVNEWWVSYGGTTPWRSIRKGVPDKDVRLADMDGDGKDDVFWAAPDGRWRASASGTGPWRDLAFGGAVRGAELMLADVDGDRRADVFWATPGDGRWRVSSAGTGSWTSPVFAGVPLQYLQLADVTGDGRADVFYADPAQRSWLLSEGAASSWRRLRTVDAEQTRLVTR